jgi:tetratricopeptide (TPR) repeat protein
VSRARRLLFGLLVAGLLLALAELGLRASGVFDQQQLLSPLLFQQLERDDEPLQRREGWVVWDDGTQFHEQPPGLRIITLGGSATAGDGVTPFASFSHQLQRILVRARPGQASEVINLGRGGMGSRQVVHQLAQGFEAFHPQLAIIYSGNNEFHELRALAYTSPAYGANLERTRRRLHGLHLYRAVQRALGRDRLAPFEPLGPGLPAVHDIPAFAEADDRALARQLYREHLEAMIELGQAEGVPLLLATVADNRAGWVDSFADLRMSPQDERLLAELDGLRMRGDRQAIAALAEHAWPATGEPLLSDERAFFRVGTALLDMGMPQQARRFLDQAELVMRRPNRSNHQLRDVVRQVAQQHGLPLCDLAEQLDARSTRGVAGNDLFVDACHPSPSGHRHLAELLASCASEAGLLPDLASPDRDPRAESLPRDPWRLDHFAERRDALPAPEGQPDPAAAAALRGHLAYADRQFDAAFEAYAQALEQGAPSAPLLLSQALVRWNQGEMDAVDGLLERARAAAPEDPEIRNWAALLTR